MKRKLLFHCILLLMAGMAALAANGESKRNTVSFDNVAREEMPNYPAVRKTGISDGKAFKDVSKLLTKQTRLRKSPINELSQYIGERTIMGHNESSGFMQLDTVTIEKVSATQLKISNYFFPEATVLASVNLQTGAISIAPQHVFDTKDGPISLCSMDFDSGTYSESSPIEGYMEDGNIYLETGLGFFVTSGSKKGRSLNLGLMDYTYIAKPNGSLTNKIISYLEGTFKKENRVVTEAKDWIFVHQTSENTIRVSHMPIGNAYVDINIRMNYDNSLSIDPQPIFYTNSTGTMNCYKMEETELSTGGIVITTHILDPIPASIRQDGTSNNIEISKWMAANTTTGKFSELFESSSLTASATISFPEMPSADFDGEGTKESPWLIKTPSDLNALSISANTDPTVRGEAVTTGQGNDAETYYPVYEGKYFKLATDLDMKGYKQSLTPIGGKEIRFAGTFDGDNHTISNFRISDYAYDYCALFGAVDEAGTVRDVKFEMPRISSLGYMVAVVAGSNFGTIDNCHVSSGKVTADEGNSVGGIAGVSAGKISDCSFKDGSISALGNMGGISGTSYADVINCHVEANLKISGSQVFVGGVAGLSNGQYLKRLIKVADCSFSGTITTTAANMGMGGVVGYAIETEVARSFAVGELSARSRTNNYLGGVVGTVYNSKIHDCYSAGRISNTNTSKVGGIAGQSSGEADDTGTVITDCYTTMSVSSMSTEPTRAMVGQINNITLENCWYDSQIMPVRNEQGVLTTEMTNASGFKGFDSSVWLFVDNMYPRLSKSASSDAAIVSASPIILAKTDSINMVRSDFCYNNTNGAEYKAFRNGALTTDGGNTFDFINGTAKLNGKVNTDTIYVTKGNAVKIYNINVAPILFEGDGTSISPWLIKTKEDLKQFSDLTNNAKLTFEGKYLKMTADIDMGGEWFTPICKDDMGDFRFEGTFDGGGFTIDNLFIQTIGYYPEGDEKAGEVNPRDPNSYWNNGLFGLLGEKGTIKNLTIGSGCHYDMFSYSGAVVGRSYGLVENCKNYATVKACYGPVGGIVGDLYGSAIVRDCYNAGNVYSGFNKAGGIVGAISSADAIVENCGNTAEVGAVFLNKYQADGTQEIAGGIAGENKGGRISDTFNSGNVVSYKTVGGIVGTQSGSVANSINIGFATSSADQTSAGAIAGSNSGKISSSCYDAQLVTIGAANNAAHDGVDAAKTVELTAENLTLSEKWQQAAGQYPVLKSFASEKEMELSAMAVVTFNGSENTSYMSEPATLGNTSDVVYSLKHNEYFKIDGNKLVVTPPASGAAKDTLIATYDGVSRGFPLQTLNADIFDGDGTSDSPFVISSSDDFLKLSEFIQNTGFSYSGMHFKATDNLDFKGKTFIPAAVGANSFQGIFDGNGQTVSNISYDATQTTNQSEAGLFGTIGEQGKVFNLSIDETNSFKAKNSCGAIAGYLLGIIDNVTSRATVTTTVRYAGGIAGRLSGKATVTNSKNQGNVTAGDFYAGGIFGANDKGSGVAISGNENSGNVTGKRYAGGIAGYASADFSNCHNSGEITATSEAAAGIVGYASYPSSVKDSDNTGKIVSDDYFAGIVGASDDHSDARQFIVENCNNSGEIAPVDKKPSGECGGIGGELGSGTLVKNCHNTGTIAIADVDHSLRWAGGIIGRSSGSKDAKSEIVDCTNSADISGLNSVGGISGYLQGGSEYAIIRNCHNTGNINATHKGLGNIGGINGNGGCLIIDSWNSGKITAIADVVGGLAGSFSCGKIERCFNTGDVVSSTSEGKIVGGLVGTGASSITDSYNFGNVEGYDEVGGLIGKGGSSAISRTYNAGKVTATDGSNIGNICPKSTSNKLTLESVYFDSSISPSTVYDNELTGLKGISTEEMCELDLGESFDKSVATYPSLKTQSENEVNNFHVATVIFADGDNASDVKNDFQVGTPAKVEWSSTPNLKINGNKVIVENSAIGEKATLTISAGELTRSYELNLNKELGGITGKDFDGKKVTSHAFYMVDGKEITDIESYSGVVIEKTTFDNGSIAVRKVIIRKH